MVKVALTGGIGSGKTTVAKLFELLNVPIYYSDERAKQLIHSNEKVKQSIKQEFGEESYINEQYNTSYIAQIVFNDRSKLDKLNSIVHPAVRTDQESWFSIQQTPYAIIENALLFEMNTQNLFDEIIVVQSNDELRIKRIMARDGITKEQVQKRFANQLPQLQKVEQADYVIQNNEEISLIQQVVAIDKDIRNNLF